LSETGKYKIIQLFVLSENMTRKVDLLAGDIMRMKTLDHLVCRGRTCL